MRYTYTFMFSNNVYVSLGLKVGNFHLFSDGFLMRNMVELPGKVNGSFGVIFGCHVVEADQIAGGVTVRTNRRIKYVHIDENQPVDNPPTDADSEEAAMAAREDWAAVECKEDWTMVVA